MSPIPDPVSTLIVGGGTVGLSAALFLAHQGLAPLVVERRPALSEHPRATGLSLRSLELFRQVGLEEAVVRAARSRRLGFGRISVETLATADWSRLTLPPARLKQTVGNLSPVAAILCAQDVLDPVLYQGAIARGARIEHGIECLAASQDEDGVSATLRRAADDCIWSVRAPYLIAADGAGGKIRRSLAIGERGPGRLGHRLINVLFRADLRPFIGEREFALCEIHNPRSPGLLISVGSPDRWVFHIAHADERPYDEDRCRALIREAFGLPRLDVQVLGAMPWEPAAWVAGRLQAGRVFLAGDAAHAIPPLGAFGMNTGIADAQNLGWKLGLVLQGRAGPALLSSYDAERRPVGEQTLDQALRRMQSPELHWDESRTTERAGAGIAEALSVALGYRYHSTAVVGPPAAALPLALQLDASPGSRLPHAWVGEPTGRRSTLDLAGDGFALLTGPRAGDWCRVFDAATTRLDLPLRMACLGREVADPDGAAARALRLSPTGALLVRPDHFIAWRAADGEAASEAVAEPVLRQILAR